MRQFLTVVAVIAGIFGGIYVLYRIHIAGAVVRYRLTVNVDVDGVTHSGSGVVEVDYGGSLFENSARILLNPQLSQNHGIMKGNAITVDLGDRGLLFVVNFTPILRTGDGWRSLVGAPFLDQLPLIVYRSVFPRADQRYPQDAPPKEIMDRARVIRNEKPEPIAIPVTELPMMVRFSDINDRHSVEEVDPWNLAAAFGSGVRLMGATFELTQDPITPMPSIWPAWLKRDKDGPVDVVVHWPLNIPGHTVGTGTYGIGTSAFKGD